jgi:hypothetical protein
MSRAVQSFRVCGYLRNISPMFALSSSRYIAAAGADAGSHILNENAHGRLGEQLARFFDLVRIELRLRPIFTPLARAI